MKDSELPRYREEIIQFILKIPSKRWAYFEEDERFSPWNIEKPERFEVEVRDGDQYFQVELVVDRALVSYRGGKGELCKCAHVTSGRLEELFYKKLRSKFRTRDKIEGSAKYVSEGIRDVKF